MLIIILLIKLSKAVRNVSSELFIASSLAQHLTRSCSNSEIYFLADFSFFADDHAQPVSSVLCALPQTQQQEGALCVEVCQLSQSFKVMTSQK